MGEVDGLAHLLVEVGKVPVADAGIAGSTTPSSALNMLALIVAIGAPLLRSGCAMDPARSRLRRAAEVIFVAGIGRKCLTFHPGARFSLTA
jgi:hypothetical protein